MYFVWICERIAISSLYSINGLVSITQMECVYCAVRAKSFNVFQIIQIILYKEPTRCNFGSIVY